MSVVPFRRHRPATYADRDTRATVACGLIAMVLDHNHGEDNPEIVSLPWVEAEMIDHWPPSLGRFAIATVSAGRRIASPADMNVLETFQSTYPSGRDYGLLFALTLGEAIAACDFDYLVADRLGGGALGATVPSAALTLCFSGLYDQLAQYVKATTGKGAAFDGAPLVPRFASALVTSSTVSLFGEMT